MNIETLYREESGRILATLIRLLGSFDLAEEAVQEAFAAALEQWPAQGTPANPRAWLVSTARNKAVDLLRRRSRFDSKAEEIQRLAELEQFAAEPQDDDQSNDLRNNDHNDDRLKLIFTCCHPALVREAQVALTLRTLCGLTTEEIARAFLVPVPTLAQRLVRAQQKIRNAEIPYRIPPAEELASRVEAVMLVVYLVFNEGYSASSGEAVIRRELCAEAIRLARLLCQLLPDENEARGLLALMLLHDSRRDARVSADGEMILLEDQDRGARHRDQIEEGLTLLESVLRTSPASPYALQAAIAAMHARAKSAADTDWRQIAALYEVLCRVQPSPVVELNRAAAVAMSEGPAAGLRLLDALESESGLRDYYLLAAARADLLRRLNRWPEAANAYRRSLALVTAAPERRFLTRRLAEVEAKMQSP
jgi:RNA polymerase sigma-70 factor, ECF subfamily